MTGSASGRTSDVGRGSGARIGAERDGGRAWALVVAGARARLTAVEAEALHLLCQPGVPQARTEPVAQPGREPQPGVEPEPGVEAEPGRESGSDFDWAAPIELAEAHHVLPLMALNLLGHCSDSVPAPVQEDLRARLRGSGRNGFLLSRELLRLLDGFTAAGIRAIPFKGPALAMLAYGKLALRPFRDLDLLVADGDVEPAHELLGALGYRPEIELEGRERRAWLESRCAYHFFRARERQTAGADPAAEPRRLVLDLHRGVSTTFSHRGCRLGLDFDELWDRRQAVVVAGAPVYTLSRNDALLAVCANANRGLWKRLEWVSSVRALLPDDRSGWDELWARAAKLGGRRMVQIGVALAHRLLEAQLPDQTRRMVGNRRLVAVVDKATRRLRAPQPPAPSPIERTRFYLAAAGRLHDRARLFAGVLLHALTPGLEDWKAVRLPAPLAPLYYLVRPLRLVGKHAARKVSRR